MTGSSSYLWKPSNMKMSALNGDLSPDLRSSLIPGPLTSSITSSAHAPIKISRNRYPIIRQSEAASRSAEPIDNTSRNHVEHRSVDTADYGMTDTSGKEVRETHFSVDLAPTKITRPPLTTGRILERIKANLRPLPFEPSPPPPQSPHTSTPSTTANEMGMLTSPSPNDESINPTKRASVGTAPRTKLLERLEKERSLISSAVNSGQPTVDFGASDLSTSTTPDGLLQSAETQIGRAHV